METKVTGDSSDKTQKNCGGHCLMELVCPKPVPHRGDQDWQRWRDARSSRSGPFTGCLILGVFFAFPPLSDAKHRQLGGAWLIHEESRSSVEGGLPWGCSQPACSKPPGEQSLPLGQPVRCCIPAESAPKGRPALHLPS